MCDIRRSIAITHGALLSQGHKVFDDQLNFLIIHVWMRHQIWIASKSFRVLCHVLFWILKLFCQKALTATTTNAIQWYTFLTAGPTYAVARGTVIHFIERLPLQYSFTLAPSFLSVLT